MPYRRSGQSRHDEALHVQQTRNILFINQRGDVLQSIIWWKRGAIRENLNANNTLTFYTKHGDYIGRFAFYPAILLIVLLLLIRVQVLLGNKIRSGSRKHAGN
jgi:apolipoprotein N-acyltransferase